MWFPTWAAGRQFFVYQLSYGIKPTILYDLKDYLKCLLRLKCPENISTLSFLLIYPGPQEVNVVSIYCLHHGRGHMFHSH